MTDRRKDRFFVMSTKISSKLLTKGLAKIVSAFTLAAVMLTSAAPAAVSADTDGEYQNVFAVSDAAPAQVQLVGEAKYNSGNTHPFNYQPSRITVRWNAVAGAEKYQVYAKGGKYAKYTKVATTKNLKYTVKNLDRIKTYKFKVRAVTNGVKGAFSKVQTLRTARIDFDKAGWQAMCRIVYHEVGGIDDPFWNKPIVHVSDCVVNRFEAAKYTNDPTWATYYQYYDDVQSMIYNSGDFMSEGGLAADGATYGNVRAEVKKAVYGALYNKVMLSSEKPSKKVFFWSNTSYKPNSSKIAYCYRIPWGYFNVWKEYWG